MSKRLARLHERAGSACLNIAHRGASGHALENTLPAFELAAELGAHMVELDVQLSADEVVVVHHDDDVLRCTDAAQRFPGRAGYLVSSFSDAELQQLAVPSLVEVLALAQDLDLLVNIELKYSLNATRLAYLTYLCVKRFSMHNQVLISCFDDVTLLDVRGHSDRVATALLFELRMADHARYLDNFDVDAIHPRRDGVDRETVRALRADKRDVNVWTVNEPAEMQQLLALGVTGIITDYPDRLASL